MNYRDTADLRDGLRNLLIDLEEGRVSNSAARARVTIAKAILDTVKVELAAAALGCSFEPVSLMRSSVTLARSRKSV